MHRQFTDGAGQAHNTNKICPTSYLSQCDVGNCDLTIGKPPYRGLARRKTIIIGNELTRKLNDSRGETSEVGVSIFTNTHVLASALTLVIV